MMSKIKVLFLTNMPSPYVISYLNELDKYCEVTAVFEKGVDITRPKSWKNSVKKARFNVIILNGISVGAKIYGDKIGSAPDDKALSLSVIKYINNKYNFIIVGNPCTPTGIIEIFYMRIKKIKYSIQSEGGFPGNGTGIKEKMKYWLMNKAEYYFSTCEMGDDYFLKYGARKDKIRRYPFASISRNQLPKEFVEESTRSNYKKKLKIMCDRMILCVARSVYVKGIDVLLKALHDVPSNVCTYIIGGKCTEEYKKIINEYNIKNIVFIPNLSAEKINYYYKAADIFVLPTRSDTWGLVISEAMIFGMPVITTNRCVAGNALIKNGINGYIVEVENSDELNSRLIQLLSDKTLRRKFGNYNYNMMHKWTYEDMGKIMANHIEQCLQERKNS